MRPSRRGHGNAIASPGGCWPAEGGRFLDPWAHRVRVEGLEVEGEGHGIMTLCGKLASLVRHFLSRVLLSLHART